MGRPVGVSVGDNLVTGNVVVQPLNVADRWRICVSLSPKSLPLMQLDGVSTQSW